MFVYPVLLDIFADIVYTLNIQAEETRQYRVGRCREATGKM
jgi:hypothetical protein